MYFALAVAAAGVVARSAVVMMPAISSSSSGPNPSVVSAGVPSRIPEVYQAPLGSRGTLLRFVTTPASSRADSAWRPVSPKLAATSASTMWLLVPPVTSRTPRRNSPAASAWALPAIADAYAANEGWRASANATALAAIACGSGPPSTIGQPV